MIYESHCPEWLRGVELLDEVDETQGQGLRMTIEVKLTEMADFNESKRSFSLRSFVEEHRLFGCRCHGK